MNFIKAKMFLEEVNSDEKITILLDDNESIDNVPVSLEREGHQILSSNLKNSNGQVYWELKIKK